MPADHAQRNGAAERAAMRYDKKLLVDSKTTTS